MKKIISIVTLLLISTILMFSVKSYAVLLDKVDVKLDKEKVKPGENVTVNVNFGESLGSYTGSISYDNKLFEYVSAEGGTVNDTTDKVKLVYCDQTGGQSPRNNMSVTFKAKEGLTSSNPTEFTVTLEGMANSDASITFDDITTPIVKTVVVEPEFLPYEIKLNYTGRLIENEIKDMKITYSSSSGRYYENARLVANMITPEGATAQLIGIDQESLKHDLLQSGWGDSQGYKIGGKDFAQVLNVQGTFSKAGDYKLILKLIDRENSDAVISEKSFNLIVGTASNQTGTTQKPEENKPTTQETPNTPATTPSTTPTTTPTKLPKTGINVYIPFGMILLSLAGAFIINNRKNK